jgi:uncharacterized protein
VYAGLSVAMAFSRLRPQYFAEIMANLLFWLGPDKLCFGSDYAIWSPKWLIEKFMEFELPDEIKKEYSVDLTLFSAKMPRVCMGLTSQRRRQNSAKMG